MSRSVEGLIIERIENGFIVTENASPGASPKQWVFETPKGMAQFVGCWGSDKSTGKESSK